jgi:hypothetical protein
MKEVYRITKLKTPILLDFEFRELSDRVIEAKQGWGAAKIAGIDKPKCK